MEKPCGLLHHHEVILYKPALDKSVLVIVHNAIELVNESVRENLHDELCKAVNEVYRSEILGVLASIFLGSNAMKAVFRSQKFMKSRLHTADATRMMSSLMICQPDL